MPELPEVEIVCQGLREKIVRTKVISVAKNRENIRLPIPDNLNEIATGKVITAVKRRAKYIIIELEGSYAILIHLGMSGRLIVKNRYQEKKHDHVIFKLQGKYLIFNDPRRFGLVTLVKKSALSQHKLIKNLGLEPLSPNFSGKSLKTMLNGKTSPVKNVIMDQAFVVGVGNIYAAEGLFLSGISPKRKAADVSLKEAENLAKNIRKVLRKAINAGGSSFSDYVDSNENKGSYQNEFLVYGRAGEPCKKCKKAIIKNIKIGGRSSFFCPACQK